jgi:hypothetical protein
MGLASSVLILTAYLQARSAFSGQRQPSVMSPATVLNYDLSHRDVTGGRGHGANALVNSEKM